MSSVPYLPSGQFRESLLGSDLCADQPAGVCLVGRQKKEDIVPPGVLILSDFLGIDFCRQITAHANQKQGFKSTVGRLSRGYESSENRITDIVPLGEIKDSIIDRFVDAVRTVIAPHFGLQAEWLVTPELLRYGVGGKFITHADKEQWIKKENRWIQVEDRDISLLAYINSGYEGGELYFPNFDYKLSPQAGSLIAFPSDHRYLHEVKDVISGMRYAFVSWVVAKGMTRISPAPGANAILL